MLAYIHKIKNTDNGASAVEYGLLVAAIAAVIVVIIFALGGVLQSVFKGTCDKIASNGTGTSATCTTS